MDHPDTLNDLEEFDTQLKELLEYGRSEGQDTSFIEFLIGLNRADIDERVKNSS